MIKIVLEEYSLINKIFAIGFNNTSVNTSIPELKKVCKPAFGVKFFHQRYACHVLNLCVQDGLKQLEDNLNLLDKHFTFYRHIHE